jgi:hypothetical protein
VLGYTAADVDALSISDFIRLCDGLEKVIAESEAGR